MDTRKKILTAAQAVETFGGSAPKGGVSGSLPAGSIRSSPPMPGGWKHCAAKPPAWSSSSSTRRRPITSGACAGGVVAALATVDYVVLPGRESPADLLAKLAAGRSLSGELEDAVLSVTGTRCSHAPKRSISAPSPACSSSASARWGTSFTRAAHGRNSPSTVFRLSL